MSNIENSIINVTKQINVEVKHVIKEIVDKARPLINALAEHRVEKKIPLTVVGPVYAVAPIFDGSTHWVTYFQQFKAAKLLIVVKNKVFKENNNLKCNTY